MLIECGRGSLPGAKAIGRLASKPINRHAGEKRRECEIAVDT
jgi:hypothetical protein